MLAGALALSGCAHRYPLAPSEEKQGLSGVAIAFGEAKEPLPQGTTVRWDFGDGSSAEGPTATHAYGFAGSYTATESVVDSHGERHAHFTVGVARRSPLMAVPPGASDAVVLDRFFNRLGTYQALLSRTVNKIQLADALARMKESLGFDPLRAEDVRSAGIDADEGVAWISFAEEPSSHYLAIGTWDDARSDAALRAVLQKQGASFSEGPNGFTRASVPGQSDDVLFLHDRGYLVIRVPGEHPEPPLASAHFTAAPPTGVAELPEVRPLRAALGSADLWLYQSRESLVPAGSDLHDAPILAHVQAALGAFNLANDELSGTLLAGMDGAGLPAVTRFFQSSQTATLSDRALAGASLYVSFSGDVQQLLHLLIRGDAGQRSQLEMDLAARGVALRELTGMFGDAAALAGYFDVDEFYRAMLETRLPLPRGEVLLGASLRDPQTAQGVVRGLLSAGGRQPSVQPAPGGTTLLSTVQGHPAGAYLAGSELLLSWGLRRFDDAVKPGPTPRLQRQLQDALPADAAGPGKLVIYVDVARVIDALDVQRPIPGLAPDQQVRAQLLARVAAAPFGPVRDLLAVVRPAPEGIRAELRLRLRPLK